MRAKPTPSPHVRCPCGERGSVSIWIATCAMVMIILVGLAVDLGGQVYAQQHARDVAGQAARAGGQQLQVPAAVRGDAAQADPARAAAAARAYLAGSDVTGSVTIRGGDTVVVHTTATYQTKFLGIIGIDSLAATGTGTARITRVVEGVGR
jgi:Flp pilus assembly protein TadG